MATTAEQTTWRPPQPQTIEDTGLRASVISHLILKALHSATDLTGLALSEHLGLPFSVLEAALDSLRAQQLCEITGGSAIGPPTYRYRITTLGRERALAAFATTAYSGVAPVPFDAYRGYLTKIFVRSVERRIAPSEVAAALSHLVLSERVIRQLGPAMNAGQSIFLYGPPGNGKTAIAMALGNLLSGDIWIPYAVEVDGLIIQVFDPVHHEPRASMTSRLELEQDSYDRRWVRCRRPLVTVGAELSLEALDLTFHGGAVRPPVQWLANGGILLIDDFGRQRCTPRQLLNRWIHPLETGVDYLSLQSGQKIGVPFLVLPVFATNIKPADLVDEAFLRRIPYKVLAHNPTPLEFAKIFENACREQGLTFDPAMVHHLWESVLLPRGIALRGCQPRDLIHQALAHARYHDQPRQLTIPLLEEACAAYFVDQDQGVSGR